MDDFKLLSPEEFDEQFINSQAKSAPVQPRESLIPKMENPSDGEVDIFTVNEVPEKAETPAINLGELYKSESMNNGMDVSELTGNKESKKKKSKGATALKVISIIMLVVTVVVFILGCFISAFLDIKGSNIAGMTFSSVSQNIDKMGLKKGDLIIAKQLPASDYTVNDFVAYPSESGEGCDIYNVQNALVNGDTSVFTLADPAGIYTMGLTKDSTDCRGSVLFYIPLLGGIINFAISNSVLVCALFVLLAALWCLIIILSGKSSSKPKKEDAE